MASCAVTDFRTFCPIFITLTHSEPELLLTVMVLWIPAIESTDSSVLMMWSKRNRFSVHNLLTLEFRVYKHRKFPSRQHSREFNSPKYVTHWSNFNLPFSLVPWRKFVSTSIRMVFLDQQSLFSHIFIHSDWFKSVSSEHFRREGFACNALSVALTEVFFLVVVEVFISVFFVD